MKRQYSAVFIGKDSLLSEGIAKVLTSANFRVVATASSVDDLIAGKIQTHKPLFIVVHSRDDFRVAADQIQLLRSNYPGARISVVSDRYQLNELILAFRAGANGFFVDVMSCDTFIKSIELIMMGQTVLPPEFPSSILGPESEHADDAGHCNGNSNGNGNGHGDGNASPLTTTDNVRTPQLSPREKVILRCLAEGDSNKSIARKINITEATVKVHVKAILRKIRVHNRTQAAIWGMNNGWLAQQNGAPGSLPQAAIVADGWPPANSE
jgi:two-component system nitrate/nitrite response regulator NarL